MSFCVEIKLNVDNVYIARSTSCDCGYGSSLMTARIMARKMERDANSLNICLSELRIETLTLDYLAIRNLYIGENDETCDTFLKETMAKYHTKIQFPKITNNIQRFYNVKISGTKLDIQFTKDYLMNTFGMADDTVMLEIDVCKNNHKYIIGDGGAVIKELMRRYKCHIKISNPHIHFAEETVTNSVTICGKPKNVERARCVIRYLCPNIAKFHLPYMSDEKTSEFNEYMKLLDKMFDVETCISEEENLPVAVVSGCSTDNRVTEVTNLLIKYVWTGPENAILTHSEINVSQKHHKDIIGIDEIQMKSIEVKSHVRVKIVEEKILMFGMTKNVLVAKEKIIGCMPVKLTFNISNLSQTLLNFDTIMAKYGVSIKIEKIFKNGSTSAIVEGRERDIDKVFQTYVDITNNKKVIVRNPLSYNLEMLSTEELAKVREEKELQRIRDDQSQKIAKSTTDVDDYKIPDDNEIDIDFDNYYNKWVNSKNDVFQRSLIENSSISSLLSSLEKL